MALQENVNVSVNKKYLDLFKEICEENAIDAEKELETRLEEALVDSFNKYSSKCIHEERALKFMKGGKSCKRVPGFDLSQIEKLLSRMETVEEKVEWLGNYLQQLQQTRQSMFTQPRGINLVGNSQEESASLTPYMKVYPQAIEAIKKKIRQLEAEQIVVAEVVHRM